MIRCGQVLSIVLGIDDAAVGSELAGALEEAGHHVSRVGPLDVGPGGGGRRPDVIVVDGDAPGLDLAVMAAGWRQQPPPTPALIVLAATAPARVAAERVRAVVLTKPVAAAALADEVTRVASAPRGVAAPTAASALSVLGLAAGGLPEDEAAAIIAGARTVDPAVVREALRPHVHAYVTVQPLLDALCARRSLTDPEARFALALDGSRTVKGVIDSSGDMLAAARLVWALVSGGAVQLTSEPPGDVAHPRARQVARLRDHLRARRARLGKPTPYDVLEVDPDTSPAECERAAMMLGARYMPERLAGMDLGDLAPLVEPLWRQILRARAILVDPVQRQSYDIERLTLEPDADARRMRRRIDQQEAEAAFVRGQRALAAGDAFRAVSELAAAARRLPDEPDYEVYVSWARVCAEEARGQDKAAAARRERPTAEAALAGRRPRPRALFALGLLCEAAGDRDDARQHLAEALACDPRLAPARQALARLGV